MKKAVITGSGCLSSNLVAVLSAAGWETIVLHRHGSNGVRGATSNRPVNSSSVSDLAAAIPHFVDAVFHVAANTSFWPKHQDRILRDNVEFTANMLTASSLRNVGRFIHTSTAAVYDPVGTMYSRSKQMAEKLVVHSGLDWVIVQPCIIVGAHDRKSYARLFRDLPRFAPPGDIEFGDARSIAEAHLKAFEVGMNGNAYLLGGWKHTWLEFFQEIASVTGQRQPIGTLPRSAVRLLCAWEAFKSWLSGNPPLLTWPMAKLMMQDSEVPPQFWKDSLALKYHSMSLHDMVQDCWDSLNPHQETGHEQDQEPAHQQRAEAADPSCCSQSC